MGVPLARMLFLWFVRSRSRCSKRDADRLSRCIRHESISIRVSPGSLTVAGKSGLAGRSTTYSQMTPWGFVGQAPYAAGDGKTASLQNRAKRLTAKNSWLNRGAQRNTRRAGTILCA
jgi:hypothetical protein